jgi:hypothetical protein
MVSAAAQIALDQSAWWLEISHQRTDRLVLMIGVDHRNVDMPVRIEHLLKMEAEEPGHHHGKQRVDLRHVDRNRPNRHQESSCMLFPGAFRVDHQTCLQLLVLGQPRPEMFLVVTARVRMPTGEWHQLKGVKLQRRFCLIAVLASWHDGQIVPVLNQEKFAGHHMVARRRSARHTTVAAGLAFIAFAGHQGSAVDGLMNSDGVKSMDVIAMKLDSFGPTL